MALVLRNWVGGGVWNAVSQPAAAESSEEMKTDMPSAAACLNRLSQNWTPDDPACCSHNPKLMLMILGAGVGGVSTTKVAAIPIPSALAVSLLTTRSMVAPCAILPERVTSRVASP